MYGILVVDDEYTIRDGIVHAIPWESCGAQVVGEAANGIEALRRVEEVHPDIVITDIHMDDMDGLQLAEILKERYPDIRIVILTGYDEFEYAKKALQLRVFSYLLKPVLPQELLQIVRELIGEIAADVRLRERVRTLESAVRINREILREKLLCDLLHGTITEDEIEERRAVSGLAIPHAPYTCLIFDLDGYHHLTQTHGAERVQIMLQCIAEAVFTVWEGEALPVIEGGVVSIVGGTRDRYACVKRVKQAIGDTMNVTISAAIGGTYKALPDVSKSYSEAKKALEFKAITGRDCVIHIDDVRTISGGQFLYPEKSERMILQSINECDEDRVREAVHTFFDQIYSRSYAKELMRVCVMGLFAVVARWFMDLGVDIHRLHRRDVVDAHKIIDRLDTAEEVESWLLQIIQDCLGELRTSRRDSVKSVIQKARQYIEDHFNDPDISLSSVAEHVYLNPAYLSKLYKKETGETYLECLTRLRVEKAKGLLSKTNIKVADVGTAVGYPNSQYFATLFKRITGLSPLDFRELGGRV